MPVLRSAVALLAPPRCLACRRLLGRTPAGPALCDSCASAVGSAAGVVVRGDAIDGGFAPLDYAGVGVPPRLDVAYEGLEERGEGLAG